MFVFLVDEHTTVVNASRWYILLSRVFDQSCSGRHGISGRVLYN